MAKQRSEEVIDVLLRLHAEKDPPFSKDLLVRCYEIAKRFQFDGGTDRSLDAIQKLVESHLATDEDSAK